VLSWEWALLLGTYWVAILKVTRRVAAHSDVACLPPLPWQLVYLLQQLFHLMTLSILKQQLKKSLFSCSANLHV